MKLNASTQGPDNEAQPQLQPSSKFIQAARRVVVAFAERASHAANRRQTNDWWAGRMPQIFVLVAIRSAKQSWGRRFDAARSTQHAARSTQHAAVYA